MISKEIYFMGRIRYHRSNINQQIHSIEFKTKYYYLKHINITRYGLCVAEAELLAEIANNYYQQFLLKVPENCYYISVLQKTPSNKKISISSIPEKIVYIPAYSHYELSIYRRYGLKSLQNYRILNILEYISFQNAAINVSTLAKIVNITPKSIRERLVPFIKKGIIFPLLFKVNNNSNKTMFQYRSSLSLIDFFLNCIDEEKICATYLLSEKEWHTLLFHFIHYTYDTSFIKPIYYASFQEISPMKKDIVKSKQYQQYAKVYPKLPLSISNDTPPESNSFYHVLKNYFCFSNALISNYLSFLEKESKRSQNTRKEGDVIYYSVRDSTTSGTSLQKTEFLPIRLTIWSQEDTISSPYKTNLLKWNKMQRYSIQAKNQNTNLSQYDLAYLLGVSIGVIKKLMKKYSDKHIPTRGNMHDIGPGISHNETIIKLYLDGYTETEIKFKTGHSYESIENYLKKFIKVVGLTDLGLHLNQIRMAAKMSYSIALKFYKIYEKYNTSEYQWILAKIRKNFNEMKNNEKKKDTSRIIRYEKKR